MNMDLEANGLYGLFKIKENDFGKSSGWNAGLFKLKDTKIKKK